MKKLFMALALFIGGFCASAQSTVTVPDESLHYAVHFKWGFINAYMGIATVATLNQPDGTFLASLSGKSVDVFGHYYGVSDRIQASVLPSSFSMDASEQIQSEHGEFDIQTITGHASGASSDGPVVAHLDNGKVLRERISNYGSGLTIDLLGVFYYIRQINYADFNAGQRFHINLNGGNEVAYLDISYLGRGSVEAGGENYPDAFHISLSFSSSVSSKVDTMNIWIANDSSRTPVLIDASLSVGRMVCTYLSSSTISAIPGFGE